MKRFKNSKMISFERGAENGRRRTLSKILKGETEKGRMMRFCVVSEPEDSNPDLECDEVGSGVIDLCKLDRDLVDHRVQIKDTYGNLVRLFILFFILSFNSSFHLIHHFI